MKKVIAIMTLAAALFGCKAPQADMNRTPIFKVVGPDGSDATKPVSIDGKAQDVTFNVMSSVEWTASIGGDEAFALATKSGGSGNTPVIVSAAENETGKSRQSVISFTAENGKEYIYTLNQGIAVPYLDVAPTKVNLLPEGGDFTITLNTNQKSWDASIEGATWITEVSRTENKITFKATENTTSAERIGSISIYSLSAIASAEVQVIQSFNAPPPAADLLDLVFDKDGGCKDVSAMGMAVEKRADETMSTKYIDAYKRYAAVFSGAACRNNLTSGYYVIRYDENATFKSSLEDGHSIEVLVKFDEIPTKQQKFFGSTQAGGTGLCINASANYFDNEIYCGGGWKSAHGSLKPEVGVYYHLVGTWNPSTGENCIYVNGNLNGSRQDATGAFKHMTTDSTGMLWFAVGADPNNNHTLGEISLHGEVVIARVYGAPLNASQVKALFKQITQ